MNDNDTLAALAAQINRLETLHRDWNTVRYPLACGGRPETSRHRIERSAEIIGVARDVANRITAILRADAAAIAQETEQ